MGILFSEMERMKENRRITIRPTANCSNSLYFYMIQNVKNDRTLPMLDNDLRAAAAPTTAAASECERLVIFVHRISIQTCIALSIAIFMQYLLKMLRIYWHYTRDAVLFYGRHSLMCLILHRSMNTFRLCFEYWIVFFSVFRAKESDYFCRDARHFILLLSFSFYFPPSFLFAVVVGPPSIVILWFVLEWFWVLLMLGESV